MSTFRACTRLCQPVSPPQPLQHKSRIFSIARVRFSTTPTMPFISAQPVKLRDPVLPTGSKILVTGANGWIGSHVVDQLLAAGYSVRGTVRNVEKNVWLRELMQRRHENGTFELVEVEDISKEGAFAESMRGVEGVIHVATVMNWTPDPNPDEVILPLVTANLNIIRAAAQEHSVKRFVYTGSSHAVVDRRANVEFTVEPDSFNEKVVQSAYNAAPGDPKKAFYVYGASKLEGERALWKWHEENQPAFPLNVVTPNLNLGPVLDVEHQGNTQALSFLRWIWDGHAERFYSVLPPQYYVDVQDCARIHLAALLHKEVQNERLFAFANPFTVNDILAAFRSKFPGRTFPADIPDAARDLSRVPKEKATRLLKEMGKDDWTSLEDVIEWSGQCFAATDERANGVEASTAL